MRDINSYVVIGAGNVAWHISQALANAGIKPLGVFSPTLSHAKMLGDVLGCDALVKPDEACSKADLIIVAVKDDALPSVADVLGSINPNGVCVHTSGSMPAAVFKDKVRRYGVLYPLQSFSKQRKLDFSAIPLFVEGCDAETESDIMGVAQRISRVKPMVLDSARRKRMHLAAVFASNFVNCCYDMAGQLLADSGVPFESLLPLIDETCHKVHELSPHDAQTGPAVRYDHAVLLMHENMLSGDALEMYKIVSRIIHKSHSGEGNVI